MKDCFELTKDANHMAYNCAKSSLSKQATITPTIRAEDGRDTVLPLLAFGVEICFELYWLTQSISIRTLHI